VSESLYSPLNLFEVSLRNAIHNAIVTVVGKENWFESFRFTQHSSQMLESSIKKLKKLNRGGTPYPPGKIVAELNFGFWTSLFKKEYERADTRLIRKGITAVFPQLDPRFRNRKYIHRRMDVIRVLRNRVYHYERIIHWADLAEQHELATSMLGWMDPLLPELNNQVDRFPAVHTMGIAPYLERIKSNLCE